MASNAPAPLWAVNQLVTSKVSNFISGDNEALIKGFHNLEYDMIILAKAFGEKINRILK